MGHVDVAQQSPATRHRAPDWLALLGWLALTVAAAAVGVLASRDAGVIYAALVRPRWAPPSSVFGPVWSALYLCMAIAAWLVWRARPLTPAGDDNRRRGLALFVVQLALNALWTWLFFAWHNGAAAFGEIIGLWFTIGITMWHFGRVRPLAAWLLAPYLAWVSFATALTWAMWQGNPGRL